MPFSKGKYKVLHLQKWNQIHRYKIDYKPLKYCREQWGFSVATKPVVS